MADDNNKTYSLQDVKDAFKAWKVPTEEDFAGLITLAGSTPLIGVGLESQPDGHPVQFKCKTDGGLDLDAKVGVRVTCAKNKGLTTIKGPLDVMTGGGLTFSQDAGPLKDALKLNLADEKGPLVDDQKNHVLYLNANHGLSCDTGPLTLKTNPSTGLQVLPDTTNKTYTLSVKCDPKGWLTIDKSGQLTIDLNQLLFPT